MSNGIPDFPVTLPAKSVVGRLASTAGPAEAVPIAALSSQLADASTINFLQSGTGAVARSVQSKERDVVSAFDYMTAAQSADVQSGAATLNVSAAIVVAFAASKHVRFPSGTYNLGTLANSNAIFDFSLAGGKLTIETEGFVKFVCASSGAVTPKLFQITDAAGVRIGAIHFQDTAYSVSTPNQGAIGIQINSSDTLNVVDVEIDALYATNMLAPLLIVGTATSLRASGIEVGLIYADTCTYGINCQNNADGLDIGLIYATNVLRSYFVYGCRQHNVNIYSKTPQASSADCLLAAYSTGLDISGIKINYVHNSTVNANVCIGFQFNGEGSKFIRGIDINASIDNTINTVDAILFRAYNLAGDTENTGATNNVFDDISLNGRILAAAATNLVRIGCQPTTKGKLMIRDGFTLGKMHSTIRTWFNLGDYSTWLPVVTFATPGDLNVVYATQTGRWARIDGVLHLWFEIVTSTFTFTTAVGALQLTGQPAAGNSVENVYGSLHFGGITKAGFTQFTSRVLAGTSTIQFAAAGTGVGGGSVVAADTPSAGTLVLIGHVAIPLT